MPLYTDIRIELQNQSEMILGTGLVIKIPAVDNILYY